MGQFTEQNTKQLIADVLAFLKIHASFEMIESLDVYSNEIVRWSRRVDLTGASEPGKFVTGPLFDALTLCTLLKDAPQSLVDVGSGGGLPGIPAAIICPKLKVTLVEPRQKRTSFLRHAVHLLKLDAQILNVRAEDLETGAWENAVAQAVWPADQWVPRGGELVKTGGAVYVLASKPVVQSDLPKNSTLDAQLDFKRPMDGADRFCARIITRL